MVEDTLRLSKGFCREALRVRDCGGTRARGGAGKAKVGKVGKAPSLAEFWLHLDIITAGGALAAQRESGWRDVAADQRM